MTPPGQDLPHGADLERMLERIECTMYADLYEAAPEDVVREFGIELRREGTELALTVESVNHPFFNRVMGVGLDRELDEP